MEGGCMRANLLCHEVSLTVGCLLVRVGVPHGGILPVAWELVQMGHVGCKGEGEKKLLCPLQLCQNNINSPNICFIVAGSIQVRRENEKDILKSGSSEKFIGDYSVCAVTSNFTLKKTTTFKPY